jgi:hypothetical protein
VPADPTDADRETAMRALGYHPTWDYADLGLGQKETAARVAQALADERERARAPFLALADELTAESEHSGPAKGAVYHIAADRIRTAAQEDPK